MSRDLVLDNLKAVEAIEAELDKMNHKMIEDILISLAAMGFTAEQINQMSRESLGQALLDAARSEPRDLRDAA
jgi:hypothetical protein